MWAMQHSIWPGEDQRHLPDSKPVPSSPVIPAGVCSQNGRAQPSLVLAGSEQGEGPLKGLHKWCSQSLSRGCCTEKGLSSPAVVLRVKRAGQGLSKALCTVIQGQHLLKMGQIFFLLTAKEPYRCLLCFLLLGAAVPQCSAETPEQAGSSVCTTRFYTSSDPKPAARASPHLCPTSEKQAPGGRV